MPLSLFPEPRPAPLHLHPCPTNRDGGWCLWDQRKEKSFQQNTGRLQGTLEATGCQDLVCPPHPPRPIPLYFQREERERKEGRERTRERFSSCFAQLPTLWVKALSANMKIQFGSLIRKVWSSLRFRVFRVHIKPWKHIWGLQRGTPSLIAGMLPSDLPLFSTGPGGDNASHTPRPRVQEGSLARQGRWGSFLPLVSVFSSSHPPQGRPYGGVF